jgi:hypothetical protein
MEGEPPLSRIRKVSASVGEKRGAYDALVGLWLFAGGDR